MKRDTWRRLATTMILAVIPTALLTTSAAPAQAFSCSRTQGTTVYNAQGVSHADVTFYSNCTDGQMHWSGVVYDDKCDGRAGEVDLTMDIFVPLDGGPQFAWDHNYSASNGCGTSSTFSGSDYDPGSPWTLTVAVGACNSNPFDCSDFSSGQLSG